MVRRLLSGSPTRASAVRENARPTLAEAIFTMLIRGKISRHATTSATAHILGSSGENGGIAPAQQRRAPVGRGGEHRGSGGTAKGLHHTCIQRVERSEDLRTEEGGEDGIGGRARNEHA